MIFELSKGSGAFPGENFSTDLQTISRGKASPLRLDRKISEVPSCPARFLRKSRRGRAPQRKNRGIQGNPAKKSQGGNLPPRDFSLGSRRAAFPLEIFLPAHPSEPSYIAPTSWA